MPAKAQMITLDDGRIFPAVNGLPVSWSLYTSWDDERAGNPRARAIIRAMAEHRPKELERERRELLKASFNQMFGHNARKLLNLIEEEISQ